MVKAAIPFLSIIIYGGPMAVAGAGLLWWDHLTSWSKILLLVSLPVVYGVMYVITSGLLSTPFHKAIIKCKVPRDLKHPVYGPRRLYGLCWTSLFYFSPIYAAVLSVPILKTLMLRLFGYKGNTNFVVYPDTWIRDLPLLDIGQDAYLSNKATIGTNICLNDGTVLVEGVSFGEKSILGHLAIVGCGSKLERRAEVGIDTSVGLRCAIGENTSISPASAVNHGARIGANVKIEAGSYIGTKSIIKDGLRLPAGVNVPAGAVLSTQEDVNALFSAEKAHLLELSGLLARNGVASGLVDAG